MEINSPLPDIIIKHTNNEQGENLRNYINKNVILYFYPKDDTSGCTQEGIDFSQKITEFEKLNTVVFGISKDSMKKHHKFIEKFDFKVELISDEEKELCTLFGVMKEKSLYGKKYMGIDRSTFLFNQEGKLIQEWRSVKVPGHIDEVLVAIHSL